MAQRFTMRDNGDATYTIVDEEMGVTLTDWVDWSQGFYLWTHLNAGVLAVRYAPASVRLERTDTVPRQIEWIGRPVHAPSAVGQVGGARQFPSALPGPLASGGTMNQSGMTVSGRLVTDPVAEVTDRGRGAVFTMTGGEVVIPAETGADPSDEGAIPDDALEAAYDESRDEARASGATYTVVVPAGAAQSALRHLRRGRSVTVHGYLDPATGRVIPDMLSSTPFLAYEGPEGWIVESHATGGGPVLAD